MTDARRALLDEVQHLEAEVNYAKNLEQTNELLSANLTIQQVRGLIFVAREGSMTSGDLAAMLGVAPNVATGIIQRLVERGLVQRYEDPHDRRVKLLSTTDHGETLLSDVRGAAQAQRRLLLEHLSDDQLASLHEILQVLARAAQAAGAPTSPRPVPATAS
ncbi:hypothetical protein GCM10025865_09700 [Paraoerskovia sediminicola]|uniref:HTH marR-type domain-containing protein n=1 Tax=Paraoerskovia sediminicola TaxID=1138587 RepID=A0ABN6XDN3_9CELL|nr:MarR family winged helix-turn-helix transcriptional regulator [Paraoerskovia sediminicola]BDZ41671.1 hypothetical protein GCM10025865_09700 [Paraoerskovia sediminicola]